jgi:hypothetical protein
MTAHRKANGGARSARKPAYLKFRAALLEFSDAPTQASLVRYLNASRALEGLDPLPRRRAPENRRALWRRMRTS